MRGKPPTGTPPLAAYERQAAPGNDAERPRGRAVCGAVVRLLLGFAALALVAWGAGEVWLSLIGNGDLEAVRDVALGRADALTAAARLVTWAGSAFLLVPLAVALSLILVRLRRRRQALLVLICLGGAMLLSD